MRPSSSLHPSRMPCTDCICACCSFAFRSRASKMAAVRLSAAASRSLIAFNSAFNFSFSSAKRKTFDCRFSRCSRFLKVCLRQEVDQGSKNAIRKVLTLPQLDRALRKEYCQRSDRVKETNLASSRVATGVQ